MVRYDAPARWAERTGPGSPGAQRERRKSHRMWFDHRLIIPPCLPTPSVPPRTVLYVLYSTVQSQPPETASPVGFQSAVWSTIPLYSTVKRCVMIVRRGESHVLWICTTTVPPYCVPSTCNVRPVPRSMSCDWTMMARRHRASWTHLDRVSSGRRQPHQPLGEWPVDASSPHTLCSIAGKRIILAIASAACDLRGASRDRPAAMSSPSWMRICHHRPVSG
jgi:hypothetical protein